MDAIVAFSDALGRSATGWLIVFAILTTLEVAAPQGTRTLSGRLRGLAFWTLFIPASTATLLIFEAVWDMLGIQPLIVLPLSLDWAGVIAIVAAPLAGALVGDFFFYWFHRIQHRLLWRYHAVHHSIRDLSAVNSYHHITETIMHMLLFVLPTSLILADTGASLPLLLLLLRLHPIFLHSPTRLNFGPLRILFADNRFHRIHHSLEPHHFDRNFGAFTTLWDRVFGTAYFPAADEWPATGLAEIDEPRSIREWLDLPSRYPRA